jgi:hypothetical protein
MNKTWNECKNVQTLLHEVDQGLGDQTLSKLGPL